MEKAQTIQVDISESILIALNQNADEFIKEMQFDHALQLFQKGKLTLTQAAELAGMNKWFFAETISRMGYPVIDYSPEDLEKEFSLLQQSSK